MTIKELYSLYYERMSKHYSTSTIYLSVWNSEGMYFEAGNCQIGREKSNCASVSKLFAFLAFGIAEKRQLISIDTTVGEMIPNLRLYYLGENMTNYITIEMLLRHSSGLPQFATLGNVFVPENDLKQHIFSLDESGEEILLHENDVSFDINFGSPIHQSFDTAAIAAFLEEVHGYLNESVLLLSTEGGTFRAGGSGAEFREDFQFWDETCPYDESKTLEENLRAYERLSRAKQSAE